MWVHKVTDNLHSLRPFVCSSYLVVSYSAWHHGFAGLDSRFRGNDGPGIFRIGTMRVWLGGLPRFMGGLNRCVSGGCFE